MRFVAEVNRRCSAVSQGYANVMRSSETPGKRFQDEDKLPKTTVAFFLLAQLIPDNQERAVVVKVCQLLLFVRLSLSTNCNNFPVSRKEK